MRITGLVTKAPTASGAKGGMRVQVTDRTSGFPCWVGAYPQGKDGSDKSGPDALEVLEYGDQVTMEVQPVLNDYKGKTTLGFFWISE